MNTAKKSTKKYSVAIDIQFNSPMHITALNKGRYDAEKGRVIRYEDENNKVGYSLTLTRMLRVMRPMAQGAAPAQDQEAEAATARQSFVDVPVIPANSVGGRLRRCAADLIIDSLIEREQTITSRAYNTLCAGSADATLKRSEATIDLVLEGKRNPYFGIFGGSAYAFTADLVVHEGYPFTEFAMDFIHLPPTIKEMQSVRNLTSVVPIVKKDDVKDIKDTDRLTSAVGVEGVAAHIAEIMAKSAAKKENAGNKAEGEEGDKKTGLTTVAAIEVVNPGSIFALRFDVLARSDAHLGLFLQALRRFCEIGQIGGRAAKGYGRFSVVSAGIYEYDENGVRSAEPKTLFNLEAGGKVSFASSDPLIQNAAEAGEAFVDNFDPKYLEALAAVKAEKKEEGGKGKGKKAKSQEEAVE